MPVDVAPVRLAVLGPPDLLVTALVAGLGTHGVETRRLPPDEALSGSASFPHGGPGILVVDIDALNPAGVVRDATVAGLTVLAIGSDTNRERGQRRSPQVPSGGSAKRPHSTPSPLRWRTPPRAGYG